MPLPVQFDAVPVRQPADFGHVAQPVLPDLGDGEVPGGREPLGGLARAQAPLRVVAPQLGQSPHPGARHLGDLQAPKVVVVHSDGGIDLHPQLVPPVHHRLVRVLAPLEHGPHPFAVAHGPDPVVDPVHGVTDHFHGLGGPLGLMSAQTPEVGPDLGVLHGGIDLVQKLVQRLGKFRVVVGGSVPVVDDAVSGRLGAAGTTRTGGRFCAGGRSRDSERITESSRSQRPGSQKSPTGVLHFQSPLPVETGDPIRKRVPARGFRPCRNESLPAAGNGSAARESPACGCPGLSIPGSGRGSR